MKRIKGSRCKRMIAGLLVIILVFSLIFPSYIQAASDEFILEENEEQVLSEETSDELILEENEEQVLSEETSDELVLEENEEQVLSEETSDELILGENEIQVFSEEPSEEPGVIHKQQRSGISVSAKMKPATSEAIYTGNSGYFNLEVGVNDPNQNGTATVHVYIKDPNAILPQFENTIGKSITTDKGHVITLMENPEKGRYLAIANVKNGDTVTQGIEIKYANGITAPTTLTVTQDDIEVILHGIDEADIVKEGGKLQFISTFYWKDVVKTANTTKPISIDENGKITGGPIHYTISANSYNNTGHGDVYSKFYSLIDTLTLPDGLTFPSGESVDIEEGSGDIWYLTTEIDGVSVRLATLSMEEMDGLEETALTIQILEKSERTLKFKIQVEQFSGDTHVLPSPKVTMNLDVTKLTASEEFVENLGGQTTPKIDNQVEFEAIPVTQYHPSTLNDNQLQIDTSVIKSDSFTSSADVKVPVSAPQSSFEVSKSVAEGDVIRDPQTGKTTIYYTLKARNTGTRTATLDIVDTLPQGMHFAENEKLEGSLTGQTEKLIGTKSGGDTDPQNATWAAVRIPKNGEFTARIAAVVDDDTPDGILKNTLTVTETGTENSQKKEHSYDYKQPKRDFSVEKSHRVHSGQEGLYKGGAITYQVVVENTGDFEMVLSSVTDQFPNGLLIDPDCFTLNGEKLNEGIIIDENQNQITFPVTNAIKTLAPGEKVIYTYDAVLDENSGVELNAVLTNTVQAVDEKGNLKKDTDTVTVREKKANLKIEKSAGNPVFVPGTDGTYAIEYTVTVRNEGDAVTEPIELTDHMAGALYPERNESDDFTITVEKSAYQKSASEGENNFIMTDGGSLKESEGKVSIDRTGEGAVLKWSVNDMPGYEPGKQYAPVFTYTYTAYADMKGDSPVHVSNAILAPKGSGAEVIGTGPSTNLAPVPQIEKIISRIDCAYGGVGNAPSHTVNGQLSNKAGKIHSGDKVTYTMTFKNEGTTEMIGALITDNLPSGFTDSGSDPYQWKLQDENVDISEGYIGGVSITAEGFSQGTTLEYALKQGNTNTQLVISDSNEDAQKAQPNGFIFPAGAAITLTVTLQFPAGETYDRHFLNGEYEAPQTPFANTVSLKGADRRGKTYQLTDHADVYPQATQARISKSADTTLLYPGDEVTFTIRPTDGNEQFFTTQAMTDMKIVEDLSRFTDFELVSYKIGYIDAYGIPSGSNRPNGNQFTFTLLDEAKKTVPFAKENASTVVLDNPIDIGSAQNKKIVWNLGDVRGAWVSNAGAGLENNWPQITLRVKEDAGIQRVTNTVQLTYNGSRSESKQVEASVGSRDLLQKIAERTVKNSNGTYSYYSIQNENEGEHLNPGDLVTFTLTYTNGTGMTQSFSDTDPLILTDVMTTLGLEPYNSEIELRYVPAENSASTGDIPVLLNPNQMEVTQADIESTSSKRTEFKIKGTLNPADKIQIRYMVKVGDGFANSEAENADGSKNDYIQDAQTPQNVSKNLHQLHNLVYYEDESGVPVMGQTDYYYAPTENRLYFSKAVQEVTQITLNTANNFSLDASKHSDDLFVLNNERQNFVKYVLVIANDPSSGEELVIDNVTDQLPDGVLPLKNNNGKDQWAIVGALCNNNQYNGSAFSSGYSGSISIGGANLSNAPFTTGYFGALLQTEKYQEAGYKPVENNVTATSQSEDAITFSIRSRSNGGNLRLKPGEFTVIAYGVYLDRSTYRRSYTNSATLNVKQTEDGTGWTALNGELQKTFVAKQKYQKLWNEQNVDTGKSVNATGTSFGASVSLISSQYRLSMTKKANAYYQVDKTKLGDAQFRKEFLMKRGSDAGTAGSTEWSAYDISDIVEWKITITNKSSAAIDDFVVTDYVPYPHKIIYYTENDKEYAGVADLPGESKAVHPAELTRSDLTESLESMGKTYRTLKSDPFRLKAGETATFYVYSYYSPTAPIVYSTVTNRAEATTASGKVFNTIDDANPVYDAEGIRIIGGTQSASVNAAYSASVSSVKSIAFEDQTAFGSSSENRTVTANVRGDKVRYTLSVTNDDNAHDMRRLTLIDNLPMPGDYGVINLSTPRESAFTVDLAEEANLVVKVNDRILTPIAGEVYNSNVFSLDQLDREEYADKYLLLYTTHGRHTGGDIEDVWHIDRDDIQEHWFTSPPEDGRVTSVLFYIPSAMKAGAKLQISFDAVIGEDAQKDAIAWNSFGFRYYQSGANQNFNSTDPMIYAEPSKVGVTIGTYYEAPKLSISKEVRGEYGDKTKSFTFTITGRQKDGSPLSGDYSYIGSGLENSGAAVGAPADGILHFENGTAEISLSHGQQITIENISYGCICKVTESQENGYTATYNGNAECGEVELKGPVSIHVVNTSVSAPSTGLSSSLKGTAMTLIFGFAGLGIVVFSIWYRRRRYKI